MKFEEIEALMRRNESLSEQYILPENFIIARLDGKGFTKLTKEKLSLEKPFDQKFSQIMIDTTKYLFNVGFKVIYGYTQSDEISLLIPHGAHLGQRDHGEHRPRHVVPPAAARRRMVVVRPGESQCVGGSRVCAGERVFEGREAGGEYGAGRVVESCGEREGSRVGEGCGAERGSA